MLSEEKCGTREKAGSSRIYGKYMKKTNSFRGNDSMKFRREYKFVEGTESKKQVCAYEGKNIAYG